MNLTSAYEDHKRDEDFDREDEKHRSPYPVCGSCNHRHYGVCGACACSKFVRCVCTPIRCDMECPACGGPSAKTPCKVGEHRAPVTHADRVKFADALTAPPEPDEECENCHGQGIVKVGQTLGGYDVMADCSCISKRCEP